MAKLRAAFSLGIFNILQVWQYRAGVYIGLNPVRRLDTDPPIGPFFSPVDSSSIQAKISNNDWLSEHKFFGWYSVKIDGPPDWYRNPFNECGSDHAAENWWEIPDFDPAVGDIKTIWEASRFDWVLSFAQRGSDGKREPIDLLNEWLSDWVEKNPPYKGINWKCGQEASIRVLHLAVAALILDQVEQPESGLISLIQTHLERIAPTIGYAIAQNNNHGTSEAAALFVGGAWLARLGQPQGNKWEKLGRKWLENRAKHLIESDGSFSQYSVNYHRLMLDTYSVCDVWRRRLGGASFSNELQGRLAAAANWLYQMVDVVSGDAPNLGANDGAFLLPLGISDYRDFRPSVQLSMALFGGRLAYASHSSATEILEYLGLTKPNHLALRPSSQQFDAGGYAILRQGDVFAVLRYPRFRFRPSHADALHVDFWVNGQNILRDGGSFSYAPPNNTTLSYFSGTASHNTVQFDGRDQMPRISRFLFGDWLKAEEVVVVRQLGEKVVAGASYTDSCGAFHQRTVALRGRSLVIEDKISGFHEKANLRWRLTPGDWKISENTAEFDGLRISVESDVMIKRIECLQGWESRYYLQETMLPVLETEVHEPATLVTTITF